MGCLEGSCCDITQSGMRTGIGLVLKKHLVECIRLAWNGFPFLVYFSKVHFCEVYLGVSSSKLCKFIKYENSKDIYAKQRKHVSLCLNTMFVAN